jgi:hypothetical protein
MSRDVHSCTRYSLAEAPQLPPPPFPPHLDLYTRVLLVSKDRRHLFCNSLFLPLFSFHLLLYLFSFLSFLLFLCRYYFHNQTAIKVGDNV